jgi:hypothetical protein
MMARRRAGRLRDGGGPGTRGAIFHRPRRARLGKAKVLQIGKRDAGHQCVSVQPRPRASLEVAKTKFLLELLMPLLADPARLDRGDQGTT